MKQHDNGYVALLAVLVTGAACLAGSLALLSIGTDSTKGAGSVQQGAQARGLANACGEEALQKINSSTTFSGSGSLTLATGTCSYTVTSTGSATRLIDAAGTAANSVRKVKIYVTITASSISVTSWQEVSDA